MNWKSALLILVLVDFAALTAYVIATEGLLGFLAMIPQSGWTLQVTVDLVIALTFLLVWMIRDARAHGISVVPFVALTLVLGSMGPLAYLVRRELGRAHWPGRAPASA